MTARDLLAGIEKRATDGPVSDWDPRGGDEPHHRVIERTIEFEKRLSADNASLVAALRAVLDLHPTEFVTYATFAGTAGGGEFCGRCKTPAPCPTVRAITEALGSKS